MPGDARASETDRAPAPPAYSTPGTIDEPWTGDSTCPQHSRQALRLVRPGVYPAISGRDRGGSPAARAPVAVRRAGTLAAACSVSGTPACSVSGTAAWARHASRRGPVVAISSPPPAASW